LFLKIKNNQQDILVCDFEVTPGYRELIYNENDESFTRSKLMFLHHIFSFCQRIDAFSGERVVLQQL